MKKKHYKKLLTFILITLAFYTQDSNNHDDYNN